VQPIPAVAGRRLPSRAARRPSPNGKWSGGLVMGEFISRVGFGHFIALVAVVGGLLIPLVAIIGGLMYKHRKLQLEAALKQQMIERGMSPEEIKEVIGACRSGKAHRPCSRMKPRETSESTA
jgi:hypothetical protein